MEFLQNNGNFISDNNSSNEFKFSHLISLPFNGYFKHSFLYKNNLTVQLFILYDEGGDYLNKKVANLKSIGRYGREFHLLSE